MFYPNKSQNFPLSHPGSSKLKALVSLNDEHHAEGQSLPPSSPNEPIPRCPSTGKPQPKNRPPSAPGSGFTALWTPEEAATAMGMQKKELLTLSRIGRIPRIVLSKRCIRFAPDDLDLLIGGM
jgi:hypothetical protein